MEKKYIYLWEFFVSTVGHVFIPHTFVEWVFYEINQKIMYIFTPYPPSGSPPSPPSDRDMHVMNIVFAAMLIQLLVAIIICLIAYKDWKEKAKTVICTILCFLFGIPWGVVIIGIRDTFFR